jgi:hypothetical protein
MTLNAARGALSRVPVSGRTRIRALIFFLLADCFFLFSLSSFSPSLSCADAPIREARRCLANLKILEGALGVFVITRPYESSPPEVGSLLESVSGPRKLVCPGTYRIEDSSRGFKPICARHGDIADVLELVRRLAAGDGAMRKDNSGASDASREALKKAKLAEKCSRTKVVIGQVVRFFLADHTGELPAELELSALVEAGYLIEEPECPEGGSYSLIAVEKNGAVISYDVICSIHGGD